MSQQGFRTLNDNVYVYQELTAGTSIAYGLDTSSNLIKIKAQSTIGATPTGTAQITIDPVAAGNITITPNITGRTVISSNLTVSAGTVVLTPLAAARPCTVRSSTLGQLSTLIDSNVNGQLLISSAVGTPIWASLTAGAGISITPGANSISIAATGGLGTTDHAVQVGNAGGSLTSIPVGTTGQVLAGITGADPAFTDIPTVTTINATTFDTNVAAAGVTLSGTTLLADGTDVNININITAKGSGQVIIDDLQLTTDLAVTEGGTGVSTLTDHGLLVGSGAAAIDALSVGSTGVILTGVTGADPTWTTATYPVTIAKGEIVCATDANVIGVVTGTGVAGQVLTSTGAASVPTWQAATGGIGTLAGDSGTATGATVTIAGGTNLTSSAAAATVTLNLDTALTGTVSHVFANAGYLATGTTAADTLLIQAYDVDGAAYVPFITLTANNTPTMDLASAVTINSNYIYRATGTDVPVTDGGTGTSTNTQNGVIYGNGASALGATVEGGTGTILVGTTGNAPSWLATGTEGKVLTSHNGSALTWETPSAGGGLTWSIVTSDLNPMVVDNGYIANKVGLLTFTLPTTCATGKILRVTGMNTALGWKIAQSANQIIHFGTSTTTTGAAGYIASVNIHDSVELVCIVADLEFVVVSSTGNITIV